MRLGTTTGWMRIGSSKVFSVRGVETEKERGKRSKKEVQGLLVTYFVVFVGIHGAKVTDKKRAV